MSEGDLSVTGVGPCADGAWRSIRTTLG